MKLYESATERWVMTSQVRWSDGGQQSGVIHPGDVVLAQRLTNDSNFHRGWWFVVTEDCCGWLKLWTGDWVKLP